LWEASSSYRRVRAVAIRKCSKSFQLFRVYREVVMHQYFSVHPSKQRRSRSFLSLRAGSSRISWRVLSLVKKTLHRNRAGLEPQHASPFRKWVKASQILGEAAWV
jgi:hypothetical protein